MNKAANRRFKEAERGLRPGESYHDLEWPARGVQAFHRSGLWATRHTGTHVTYRCTVCQEPCATFERSVHAFTRSAKGKAAVRAHVFKSHPEKLK